MAIRFIFILALIALVEWYFFQSLKWLNGSKIYKYLYMGQWAWIFFLVFIVIVSFYYKPSEWHDFFRMIMAFIFIVETAKLFGVLFLILDDIRRLMMYGLQKSQLVSEHTSYTLLQAGRSDFFSKIALLFTIIPFLGFIYGIIKGGYNLKIHQVKLSFPNFPKDLSGLKIIQISDLHLGSFFSTTPVEHIVKIVNREVPDIIVFTGDLVNNIASEAEQYIGILSNLSAPYGMYSILGNHDYGDYVSWESNEAKSKNLEVLKNMQQKMGFRLLMNEHVAISKDNESIAILGVENWGANLHFPKYGNLKQAHDGTHHYPFKILLSHDPSHWDVQVKEDFKDIDLTLSGHTHGFQFGIESKALKWSPSQWVYKHWAGLYQKDNQYLYVNRGVGFIGYPGRLGIWPEITIIELSHKA